MRLGRLLVQYAILKDGALRGVGNLFTEPLYRHGCIIVSLDNWQHHPMMPGLDPILELAKAKAGTFSSAFW